MQIADTPICPLLFPVQQDLINIQQFYQGMRAGKRIGDRMLLGLSRILNNQPPGVKAPVYRAMIVLIEGQKKWGPV